MKSGKKNYNTLISHIRGFCDIIRGIEAHPSGNLKPDLFRILSLISEEMMSLKVAKDSHFVALPDLDYRYEMFCRLLEVLAPRINNADAEKRETLVSNLADDLTDLYFELKRGLDLLALNPAHPLSALSLWRTGYELHWKEHLESALVLLNQYSQGHLN